MKKNNHKGKRLLAGLLSFLMVATTLPFGEMEVKATSLVPNTTLTAPNGGGRYPYMDTTGSGNNSVSYGSSSSTGFTFQKMGAGLTTGRNTNYDPADVYIDMMTGETMSPNIGNTNSFNITAVRNDSHDARSDTEKGYDTTVRTSYGLDYWTTYYGFGEPRQDGDSDASLTIPYLTPYIKYDPDGITPRIAKLQGYTGYHPQAIGNNLKVIDSNIFPIKLFPATYNGGVTEIQIPGNSSNAKLEVRQEIKPDDDDNNLLISYTVFNPTNNRVKFMIGNESDTLLYNHDKAPILVTQNGQHLHMMENLSKQ